MRTLAVDLMDDGSAVPDAEPSSSIPPAVTNLAVAAVVVVGIGLRFISRSPLWLDEALSVNISHLGVGDLLEALRHDGHPPLYYLVLHGWMELVGEGDAATRALSGIFGVAALPLMWIAGRRLAGPAGARWALVLGAVSPYWIRYSTEARMYSLIMLLSLAGYLLVTDALRQPTWVRLVGIGLISGLLLLTHYWSFWLVVSVGVLLVLRWRRLPGERTTTGKVIAAVAAGGVLFLPWLGGFLYQSAHTGTPWGEPYRPTELVQATLNDLGGGLVSEAIMGGTALLILALLALFVVRSSGNEMAIDVRTAPTVRRELAVVALTVGIGCVVGYLTSSTYQSRYAAVFVPLLLLAAAVGITRVPGRARLIVGGGVVGLSLAGVAWVNYYQRTQSEEVAAAIGERAQAGDVVVFCPDQLGPAYSRALPDGDGLVELAYPALTPPDRVDWVDYADRNAAADPGAIANEVRDRAGANSIFVIWMPEYRTLTGQCEGLVNALGRSQLVMTEDGEAFYEPANLHWFPGAGS